jgi:uncharacterized membrane protein (UPF0127 family)
MTARRCLAAVALLVAIACTSHGLPTAGCGSATAAFGDRGTLQVEIADTDDERQHGLMGITDLPTNHGMAFRWEAPTDGTFWMKDTLIPLSVAFVDADGTIVTIQDMDPCVADPCPTYAATAPYVTAIEANQGWFEDHRIDVGDEVTVMGGMCS